MSIRVPLNRRFRQAHEETWRNVVVLSLGVMPLYAVLAREYFDQRIMGTVFGAAIMLSSLGMALGPVVGGWIFDTWHHYRWLYMSSTAVALAAAAVAFAFPPLPRAAAVKSPGPTLSGT